MRKYRKKEGVFMFNKDKPTRKTSRETIPDPRGTGKKISHGQFYSDCKTSKCGHGSGMRYV